MFQPNFTQHHEAAAISSTLQSLSTTNSHNTHKSKMDEPRANPNVFKTQLDRMKSATAGPDPESSGQA